jgi:hypothetical protein
MGFQAGTLDLTESVNTFEYTVLLVLHNICHLALKMVNAKICGIYKCFQIIFNVCSFSVFI